MEEIIHGIIDGLHILATVTLMGDMIYNQSEVAPVLTNHLATQRLFF